MANIHVLDQNTINKIAAGEVIERPASVVKELLENAIDAKATAITVEIRDGGISFIRVTDNGCGIPGNELPLAFLRHSTSKIQSVEDLFTIASLGFRGEALSSIGAVAQVEVITKTSDSLTGTRYQIEGGEEKGCEEIGAPEGTTFIVRNLFYNTPVRRKFLKTAATEGAHVADFVEKIALSHPEISIRFIQNNQNKLHTSGNHNIKDIIYTVFGREIAANLLPVEMTGEAVSITGFIGKPVIARSNRNFENYFINGRYIKSGIITKAIEEAFKPFMMQHKYPFALLHIQIEPELLDVNVHPTKMELRFQNGEQIFRSVQAAILQSLNQKELIPDVTLNEDSAREQRQLKRMLQEQRIPVPEPFEQRRMSSSGEKIFQLLKEEPVPYEIKRPHQETPPALRMGKGAKPTVQTDEALTALLLGKPGKELETEGRQPVDPVTSVKKDEPALEETGKPGEKQEKAQPSSPTQLDLFEEKLLEAASRSRHRLIGQLFDTYWLVEFHQSLYIIDQHAAHEKVLYEKTMATLKTRQYTCQMVNPPIILTLSSREAVMLKENLQYFTDIGFEIEPFGGREYAVRGVPDNLFSIAKKELLMEMLDGLTEDMQAGNPQVIYEKVASMSCKAAVKGNHHMTFQEADQLIDQLLELENPYACPHGRPTIIAMTQYELEKKFKRVL